MYEPWQNNIRLNVQTNVIMPPQKNNSYLLQTTLHGMVPRRKTCIFPLVVNGAVGVNKVFPSHFWLLSLITQKKWWFDQLLAMLRYSIDAYMNCVDACYQTLKHKMNGRRGRSQLVVGPWWHPEDFLVNHLLK